MAYMHNVEISAERLASRIGAPDPPELGERLDGGWYGGGAVFKPNLVSNIEPL